MNSSRFLPQIPKQVERFSDSRGKYYPLGKVVNLKLVTKAKEDPKIITPSVNQVPKTANKPIKNGIVTIESLQAELAEQKVCENWKTF